MESFNLFILECAAAFGSRIFRATKTTPGCPLSSSRYFLTAPSNYAAKFQPRSWQHH